MLLVIVLNIIVLTTQISIHGGRKEDHNHSTFKAMEDLNIFEYAEVC